MHGTRADAQDLTRTIVSGSTDSMSDIVLCPPFTLLSMVRELVAGSAVSVGAQDCHAEAKGAFTGDVSAEMIADLGGRYVIAGHSERRVQHKETSAQVAAKAAAALRAGLTPIICVGETLTVREAGHAEETVAAELKLSLPLLRDDQTIVIAYEPIWAIGTGRTCSPADIVAMHDALRATLASIAPRLAQTRILYGGSVKADNARDILSLHNVDGALVGGASLKADDFLAIASATPTLVL